jgi:hypothetical protein
VPAGTSPIEVTLAGVGRGEVAIGGHRVIGT